jgi:thiol-disulfide isomerase/thioredoxin
MFKKAFLMLALCAGLALPDAYAAELTYNPTAGSSDIYSWGSGRKENYDIAIKLDAAGLVGAKIKGVTIPINPSEYVSNYSVWLSSELNLKVDDNKKKINDPDIASVSVTPANDELTVVFDEPYTITADGVYVGLSCEVSEASDAGAKAPFIGAAHATENGFFVHSSRTYLKWIDKSSSLGFTASIDVLVDGDFVDNAASFASINAANAKTGDKATVKASISNFGLKAISSLDFSYVLNSQKGTTHLDLSEPIPNYYGYTGSVEIEIPAYDLLGENYDLELTIDKVNGTDNNLEGKTASTKISYYSFVPVHRSIEEEYTGTWCGWCPRGFAALEHMSAKYPDFIGIAYHYGDAMQVTSTFPNTVSGYPGAWFDRKESGDPFYGVNEVGAFPVEQEWLDRCNEFTPVALDVTAAYQSGESNLIDVTATATFAADMNDLNYKLTYILIADDLYGEGSDWIQSNYHASYYTSESVLSQTGVQELADFCAGGKYGQSSVAGLHFNDVAIIANNQKGIANSIPSSVKNLESVNHTYQFDVTKANNLDGVNLVQNRSKLRVVALLLDANTGYVINGARADVTGDTTGAASAIINGQVVSSEYYDLSGRRVITPSNGIYVKRVAYSDGTVKTSKVTVR